MMMLKENPFQEINSTLARSSRPPSSDEHDVGQNYQQDQEKQDQERQEDVESGEESTARKIEEGRKKERIFAIKQRFRILTEFLKTEVECKSEFLVEVSIGGGGGGGGGGGNKRSSRNLLYS